MTTRKTIKELAQSWLQVRVRRSEKSLWVKAAQREGKNLSQWVTDTLNCESRCGQ
jgi:uncharacterized protein (DUF1778 family)